MAEDLFDVEGPPGGDENAPRDILLRLHVQPGAGKTAVTGRYGDALGLRIAASPQNGRANAACLLLVAELFDVPAARVELARGEKSREKAVRVRAIDVATARRLLDQAVERVAKNNAHEFGPHRTAR